MKKTCLHAGCNYYYNLLDNGFCEYHWKELQSNGKSGHITCSWCTDYKEEQQETEDMLRSRFDVGSGVNLGEEQI